MNGPGDLTRWNRAGLARFRYVDGNAATLLEELRLALLTRFLDPPAAPGPDRGADLAWWKELFAAPPAPGSPEREELDAQLAQLHERLRWQGPEGAPSPLWTAVPGRRELEGEWMARLIEQYEADRRDLGWEIGRAFTRAFHLLTEHLDAYANEGFLRTATQWESVRRLAAMLDARPAPPASAATVLVLTAKDGRRGTVARGFQVQHTPAQGGAPVVFATLEDLEVDAALNALRPAGFDRSPAVVAGSRLDLAGRVKGLRAGEPLLLEDETTGALHGYVIRGVLEEETATRVDVAPAVASGLRRGFTAVHAAPKDRVRPLGPAAKGAELGRTLHLTEEPAGLLSGEVAWISDGRGSLYRRVERVAGRRVLFAEALGGLTLERLEVGRPVTLPVASLVGRAVEQPPAGGAVDLLVAKVAGDWSRLVGLDVGDAGAPASVRSLPVHRVFGADARPPGSDDAGYTFLRVAWRHGIDSRNPQALFVPPVGGGIWRADRFLVEGPDGLPSTLTTGIPKKAAAGDLVAVASDGRLAWGRLGGVAVDEAEGQAALTVRAPWRDRGGAPFFLAGTTVFAHFERRARLAGWDANETPVAGQRVVLAAPVPEALRPGRLLYVQRLDAPAGGGARALALEPVGDGGTVALVLDAPVPADATVGTLAIRGNVVAAGHGERKEEKVLGSGDASRQGQTFVLREPGVSFVADPGQPTGVRADLDLRVGDRLWRQVPSFADSGPADPHFSVRVTEEGWLELTFGDGRKGRRLPTGLNNVRVSFRVGTGLAGNLPAGSLEKPVKPHPLLTAVRQPVPATGGNDLQDVDSLRGSAPGGVATLGRAVSLDDFGRLAATQSSVWQARSFALPAALGRHESVRVVVVPAGGGPLGGLAASLAAFLEANAPPGVAVLVERYRPVPVALRVTVQVLSAEFDPERVGRTVRDRLLETFGLRARRLGQPMRLAEIYQVVETVSGVANSLAVFNADPEKVLVAAPPDGAVHLDGEQSSLVVATTEFEL